MQYIVEGQVGGHAHAILGVDDEAFDYQYKAQAYARERVADAVSRQIRDRSSLECATYGPHTIEITEYHGGYQAVERCPCGTGNRCGVLGVETVTIARLHVATYTPAWRER